MRHILIASGIALGLAACGCPEYGDPDWGKPTEIGKEYSHLLTTYCGIRMTIFDERLWEAHPPPELSGSTAPEGWADQYTVGEKVFVHLYTSGVIVLLERDLARFTNDHTGESVDFTAWPPERGALRECPQ